MQTQAGNSWAGGCTFAFDYNALSHEVASQLPSLRHQSHLRGHDIDVGNQTMRLLEQGLSDMGHDAYKGVCMRVEYKTYPLDYVLHTACYTVEERSTSRH